MDLDGATRGVTGIGRDVSDRRARELLKPDHESVAALRKAGFAAAHSVPRGRMLPGSGSIIVLRGDTPPEMVLRPDVSLLVVGPWPVPSETTRPGMTPSP